MSHISNRLIVGGESWRVPRSVARGETTVSNFRNDGELRFASYARTGPASHLVIHETLTRTVVSAARMLQEKSARSRREGRNCGRGYRYGVHLIVAPDGHVSQHADLLNDRLVHANQLNPTSVGIAVVNPYTANELTPPFTRTTMRQWWTWVPRGAPARYTVPTPEQLSTLTRLVPFVVQLLPDLPLAFPTADLGPRRRRVLGWNKGQRPEPGIVARRDFTDRTDGRYPLEHLIHTLAARRHARVG